MSNTDPATICPGSQYGWHTMASTVDPRTQVITWYCKNCSMTDTYSPKRLVT